MLLLNFSDFESGLRSFLLIVRLHACHEELAATIHAPTCKPTCIELISYNSVVIVIRSDVTS